MTTPTDWHIFCRVIDNFGDIGVCWRLATQLAQQFSRRVTLWVDDLHSFRALCPAVDPHLAQQHIAQVTVRHWPADFPHTATGQVVIEAFGCHLPPRYIDAMAALRPIWLNLEYLSAEAWVKDYHLNQSPVHGLRKTFFFPGFEAGTGGLLWDPALRQLAAAGAAQQRAWRPRLGLPAARPNELTLSLFAYENAALPELLAGLASYRAPVTLAVPRGRVAAGVDHWLGQSLGAHQRVERGSLRLVGLPFLGQADYDQLLALCDLNFVRGEDSFVRSQMLDRPIIWHIYPQQEAAHLVKLEAFLTLYCAAAPAPLAGLVRWAHRQWNEPQPEAPDRWHPLLDQLRAWRTHARDWRRQQCEQGDLASNIVHFCSNQV